MQPVFNNYIFVQILLIAFALQTTRSVIRHTRYPFGASLFPSDGVGCSYTLTGEWRHCRCELVGPEAGKVFCRHASWITIPKLPQTTTTTAKNDSATTTTFDNGGGFRMTSLSIIESGLIFIEQDSFKGQNIQLIDLSHNQILTINLNAFRGLQNGLYQLSLNHNSLESIPGESLRNLYKLQYLYLRHNHITTIPSSVFNGKQLKSLKFLHLDDNLISSLVKNSLTKLRLQLLTLGNNRISEIHPNALPKTLWFLNLKNNGLWSIPFGSLGHLKDLKMLDLEGNNITRVAPHPTVTFANRINLLLSNNRIKTLDKNAFSNFNDIDRLDLSYNALRSIPSTFLGHMEKLQTLDMSYNSLANIPDKAFERVGNELKQLNLEENNFHALPSALTRLRRLEKLNLNNNKLIYMSNHTFINFKSSLKELRLGFNSLSRVPTESLEGMTKLHFLDLSKNSIDNLGKLAFGTFEGAGTSLVRLNLAGNRIKEITDGGSFLYMSSLAYLDVSHNQISDLSGRAFARLSGLESLFLHNNRLTQMPTEPLKHLSKLRYLVLDDNNLMNIPPNSLKGLDQLEQLSIARNNLFAISKHSFPSASLKNLKTLNLAYNQLVHLSTMALSNLTSLEIVNLEGNLIMSLNKFAFYNLPNIRRISLSHNKLNTTFQMGLTDLPQLESLDLSYNRLKRVEDGTLRRVPNLESINLSHNLFKSFTTLFLETAKGVRNIDLSNNKLRHVDLSLFRHSLQRINLRNNHFRSLEEETVSGFSQLLHFDLAMNALVEIHGKAFYGTPKLRRLILARNYLNSIRKGTFSQQEIYALIDLSHNSLKKLGSDIFGVDNVYSLNLAHNQLKDIPYEALNSIRNSLTTLDLRHNKIRSLESALFSGLGNLSTLLLSNNAIQIIEEAAFKDLHQLRHLDLSRNPVTSWHPSVFKELGHSIETLNLANTGLFSLPKLNPRGIRSLNLSHNRIYSLERQSLGVLSKLTNLDLSHNQLKTVKSDLLNPLLNLQHLNLSHNPIESLQTEHFSSLHKLETLHLAHLSNVRSLPPEESFWHLRYLRTLHLHTLPQLNKLNVSLLLGTLPPLRSLHIDLLNEKELNTQLHTADFRFLRDLYIRGKNLKSIKVNAFRPLRGYQVRLQISQSQIKKFNPQILMTLSRITFLELDLSENKLSSFQPFEHTRPPVLNLHGTILSEVHLQDNPLECHCALSWIQPWFEHLKRTLRNEAYLTSVSGWNRTYCHSPPTQYTAKVYRLNFSQMTCTANGRSQANPLTLIILHTLLFILQLLPLPPPPPPLAAAASPSPLNAVY